MRTRRQFLASLLTPAGPCYAICGLDGEVLEQSGSCAANPPGSTIKPLIATLLNPALRFLCLRRLRVSGLRLDCSHAPIAGPVDVETALAASCNSWFAQAARRLDAAAVMRLIQSEGGQAGGARTEDELTLQVLGIHAVFFTPASLARVYVRLRRTASPAIRRGLEGAMTYGTASRSAGGRLILAGKTGTVLQGAWFAGWSDREVIALFTPGGAGAADAAPAAAEILAKWRAGSAV